MDIRVPDQVVAGTFAVGVHTQSAPEVITLDFLVDDVDDDTYVVVQRIRLTPSALEPFYLELGNHLQQRRETEGGQREPNDA